MSRGFLYRRRVHYQECDPHGIIFNSHMYAYLDEALKDLAQERPELSIAVPGAGASQGLRAFATSAHLRFLLPISFGDDIEIEVEPTGSDESRVTWRLVVTRADEQVAEGTIEVHLLDENGESVAVPQPLRSELATLATG